MSHKVLSAFEKLLQRAYSASKNEKKNLEKIRGDRGTNQISKHLVEKCSTERTAKTAFLHKVLSRFQTLSVGRPTVYK
jgi:hypothetical protein